ncbi:MAG: ABC transporter ATP-binding protein [Oscillospiraceae bacterium]|nr:ABC transporter ATP-binding protein [Oscillospiraceae bacterium]
MSIIAKKTEAIIKAQNLRKVYKLGREKVVALDNINIEIKKGEVCCILGTSGSGKSTLLNMLAGLEKPTRGDIIVNKHIINKLSEKKLAVFRQKYIGFVFQSYNLIPTLTAVENVALPLVFKRIWKRKRMKMSQSMLKLVGLGDRVKHKPTQMSGGQQQRVGIARAFVSKPSVVFADEPTGNLDSKTTVEVIELMIKVAKENNLTLVIVTHDREIAEYSDRIIQLKDGNVTDDYTIDHTHKIEKTEETEELTEIQEIKEDLGEIPI